MRTLELFLYTLCSFTKNRPLRYCCMTIQSANVPSGVLLIYFQLLRLPARKCFWKLMKNNSAISVTICQLHENNCLFCCPVEFETNGVRTQFSLWCLRKIYNLVKDPLIASRKSTFVAIYVDSIFNYWLV